MAGILVFGDSIAFGYYDKEGGWVDRLRRYCIKKSVDTNFNDYYEVYNLGRPGDTSEHILKRFPGEMKARYWEDLVTVVIFAFGTNDSIVEKGKVWVSEEEFRENVRKLIRNAQKSTDKIVFVGPPPVNDKLVDPMPWEKDLCYKNELVKKYSDIMMRLCRENKCEFINIYEEFVKRNYETLLADGAHPNGFGHEIIYGIVKQILIKNHYIGKD